MTTSVFARTEARLGRGVGGETPRRLIPTDFRGTETQQEPGRWPGSLFRVAAVVTAGALSGLGVGLALVPSAYPRAVIATTKLAPPASSDRPVGEGVEPFRGPGASVHLDDHFLDQDLFE